MAEIEKIGRVSSASVKKHTGKDWGKWIAILDKSGARGLERREITEWLKSKYELSTWWRQCVVTGYEIHIGRKIEGRNAKGEYSTVATRVLPRAQKEVWAFLESESGLALWLQPLAPFHFERGETFEVDGGVYGEVRTLKKPERLRLRWIDGDWPKHSVLDLAILARPGHKCILVFQHGQLPSERARSAMNARWKEILSRIQKSLS